MSVMRSEFSVHIGICDDALIFLPEKRLCIVPGDPLECADAASLSLPDLDAAARPPEHDKEVHPENASGGIVLHSQINVLRDSEPETARIVKARVSELILLDLEGAVQNLPRLFPANSHKTRYLFIPTDSK